MTSEKPTGGRTSPFKRPFIIDGIPQAVTPEMMLLDCAGRDATTPAPAEPLADETLDIAPGTFPDDGTPAESYLPAVLAALEAPRKYPVTFPESYACARIAASLLEALFRSGHFHLEDLGADLEWNWNGAPMGNMAALYASVQAACEYIENLGIRLRKWGYNEAVHCSLGVRTGLAGGDPLPGDEELIDETSGKIRFGRKRRCPATLPASASDWIVYIPFDSCEPRLGGSVLAEAVGAPSATAPDIGDADYFIDCYEVVRELIEDGIVRSGVPVGPGGLLTALNVLAVEDTGADIDIALLRKSWDGVIPVRALYGEVPGVLITIADIDFDYIDAELLLQDVAYFPLGHPAPGRPGIRIAPDGAPGISSILESLLNASEGED